MLVPPNIHKYRDSSDCINRQTKSPTQLLTNTIIFEFKNYSEPITQKEIYTTEKYLYAKALRSVGIIIAQNGYDENAYWAAKGCLRENGKLLILLRTEDLFDMSIMKEKQEDPSNYLLDKLDDILLELEK